jgi:hypothetical protein
VSIVFDLDRGAVHVGAWRISLSDVSRLWLIDVVRPGIPDEHEYRYVVESGDWVYLAPDLHIPTQANLEALQLWSQSAPHMYFLQRLGWPMVWGAWMWMWCAMRGQTQRFKRRTFDLVAQGAAIEGPMALDAVLAHRAD